ncbi:MAG: phosphate ABC transporter permease subunit PstC [Agathobacter sp.]|nr:phosphate ABC transporter permease subunit PstC [Agathobacter sp.]
MKKQSERIAKYIFMIFGCLAVVSVIAITLYMFLKGMPAVFKVGVPELLFGTVWKPTAAEPSYGILYIILSSIIGTAGAVILGVPIGLLTAVFLTDLTSESKMGRKISAVLSSAVELLAAIPSVIYGLIGMMILNPFMYKMEKLLFENSDTHQFTGGANLLSAIIVLAIMILPTVINISASSIRAVPQSMRAASLALGATKLQTIFKVVIPAASSGIMTGVVLGIGRALGEAMAINMVAGGSVNIPLPFNSVRFLTTQLVSEMSYSSGLHRQVLFTVGLVLYIFIVLINLMLTSLKKKGEQKND